MQVPKISQNIGHNLGIRKLKCSDEIGSLHPTPTKQNNTTWKTNKQTKNWLGEKNRCSNSDL